MPMHGQDLGSQGRGDGSVGDPNPKSTTPPLSCVAGPVVTSLNPEASRPGDGLLQLPALLPFLSEL